MPKVIRIHSKMNAKTGLIAAFSDDLRALLVVGRSISELEGKLPGAIREVLEAEGNVVAEIDLVSEAEAWSGSPRFRAEANLTHAS